MSVYQLNSDEEARQVAKMREGIFLTDWEHGYCDEQGQYHELPSSPANEFAKIKVSTRKPGFFKKALREVKYALYFD